MSVKKSVSVFVAAGELSGDLIGADLVLALRDQVPRLEIFGLTGPALRNAGVHSIGDIKELSVMGFAEVAARLSQLRQLESRILTLVDRQQPKVAILIDNPGFNFRLAEQLRLRGVKVVQYVAPKLWAWGAGRAERLRRDFDLVLGILPFEKQYFLDRQIPYRLVGNPHKDRLVKIQVDKTYFGWSTDTKVVALLPGSRLSEIERILPAILEVAQFLQTSRADLKFVMPIAPNLDFAAVVSLVRSLVPERAASKQAQIPAKTSFSSQSSCQVGPCLLVHGMSAEMMAVADVALVASGTATLECALVGTPMAVLYVMSNLTYQIARSKVDLPYYSLVNLQFGRLVANEFIQDIDSRAVAKDLQELLSDTPRRQATLNAFRELRRDLKGGAAQTAAALIKPYLVPVRGTSRARLA